MSDSLCLRTWRGDEGGGHWSCLTCQDCKQELNPHPWSLLPDWFLKATSQLHEQTYVTAPSWLILSFTYNKNKRRKGLDTRPQSPGGWKAWLARPYLKGLVSLGVPSHPGLILLRGHLPTAEQSPPTTTLQVRDTAVPAAPVADRLCAPMNLLLDRTRHRHSPGLWSSYPPSLGSP